MLEKFKDHRWYYVSLVTVVVFGIIGLINTAYNRQLQMIIVSVTTLFYVSLGIIHHVIDHDLTVKIVIEYILIGSLGMTLFAFLLSGVI